MPAAGAVDHRPADGKNPQWNGRRRRGRHQAAIGREQGGLTGGALAERWSLQITEPTLWPSRRTSQIGQSGLSFARCIASLSELARTSFFFSTAPPGLVTLLILYSFIGAPDRSHRGPAAARANL